MNFHMRFKGAEIGEAEKKRRKAAAEERRRKALRYGGMPTETEPVFSLLNLFYALMLSTAIVTCVVTVASWVLG
jgi:hypothetical protein